MGYVFLHMGCDLDLAKEAAEQIEGVTLEERQHSGCKLRAESGEVQNRYYEVYNNLFEKKYLFPVGYRQISTAPEKTKVHVMWGSVLGSHEFGLALRSGRSWFIYGQANEFANGRPCATPRAWRD